MHDLLIRGGRIIDGTGADAFSGDIAVADGRIVEVGRVTAPAHRTINADGALVTPGFLDIHTHYDGQVSWDAEIEPSASHGVTTAVMGNCGVGFAPCRPQDRDTLIALMEGVEDIPGTALHEGIDWRWESFPAYLDALAEVPRSMDIGVLAPHNPIRLHVMGERAVRREAATPDDLVAMQDLLVEALQAGALGFSTADTVGHRDAHGNPTYARRVAAAELFALGEAMGKAGLGVIQIFNDFYQENAGDFPTIVELARRSRRPLSFTFEQDEAWPQGFLETVLEALDRENAAGVQLKAQVAPRAIGGIHSLEGSINPFMTRPSYRAIAHLPHAARIAAMREPDLRARILSEPDIPISDLVMSVTPRAAEWGKDPIRMAQRTFLLGREPDYEQPIEQSLFGLVQASGRSGEEILYDHLLTENGRGQLFVPVMNYVESDYEAVRRMMQSPHAILGLSDGGAHVGYICDGSFPTYLLSHWTRDRKRGPKLRLEDAVRLQTTRPADQMGLADRGRIAPGLRADLNIIDHARLKVGRPTLHNDLPAGGTRFLQGATGYIATFVAGTAVRENDKPTGARPGRLLRSTRAA